MSSARTTEKAGAAPLLLIDTNVWLDYYLGFRENSKAADALMCQAIKRGAQLLYAVQSLRDVYLQSGLIYKRQFRKEYGELTQAAAETIRQASWSFCNNMGELACAVGADESDVWLAKKNYRLLPDLEDNFIVAAATRSRADFLVTNDRQLILKSTVATITPKDLLAFWGDE